MAIINVTVLPGCGLQSGFSFLKRHEIPSEDVIRFFRKVCRKRVKDSNGTTIGSYEDCSIQIPIRSKYKASGVEYKLFKSISSPPIIIPNRAYFGYLAFPPSIACLDNFGRGLIIDENGKITEGFSQVCVGIASGDPNIKYSAWGDWPKEWGREIGLPLSFSSFANLQWHPLYTNPDDWGIWSKAITSQDAKGGADCNLKLQLEITGARYGLGPLPKQDNPITPGATCTNAQRSQSINIYVPLTPADCSSTIGAYPCYRVDTYRCKSI